MEGDVRFDPIEIRFLSQVGVILQSQPFADTIKGFFIGRMVHPLINKQSIIGI